MSKTIKLKEELIKYTLIKDGYIKALNEYKILEQHILGSLLEEFKKLRSIKPTKEIIEVLNADVKGDIKPLRKQLCKEIHPDQNLGNLKIATEAYQYLTEIIELEDAETLIKIKDKIDSDDYDKSKINEILEFMLELELDKVKALIKEIEDSDDNKMILNIIDLDRHFAHRREELEKIIKKLKSERGQNEK